jgi:hypothetical protein
MMWAVANAISELWFLDEMDHFFKKDGHLKEKKYKDKKMKWKGRLKEGGEKSNLG